MPMKLCGARRQRARTEDEHETAGARVLPRDLPNTGDSRLHDPSKDVEADEIPDVDGKPVVNALFDRDLEFRCVCRLRSLARPEAAVDDGFIRFEVVAIGDDVLAPE